MSKIAQAREFIDNFPIQKIMVGDMETEYKVLDNQSTSGNNKDSTPLLFVPGLRITMDMWPPTLLYDFAQSNYRVIVYNNRGTGNSSGGTKDYTISQLARDAADLLDALDIGKAHILGW